MIDMTKADKILIVCIMILSIGLIFPLLHNAPTSKVAVVQVANKEVLRIDLTQNKEYTVKGKLGPVHIQVKDGAVRVRQENSPHHTCSKQGYVSNANTPIVCLPNEMVVQIEDGQDSNEDTVIQ